MRKIGLIIRLGLFIVTLIAFAAVPEMIASTDGVIWGMANFITAGVTWTGKQNMDYFIKPMFIGKSPFETKGVRIIPNAQSNMKLNYFGAASKLLKAWAKGFSGTAGVAHTQRTLSVYKMKAEAAEDAQLIEEVSGKGGATFSFANALIPTTLVEGVRTLRRKRLHQRAAQAIESLRPNDFESLAHHYYESGDVDGGLRYSLKTSLVGLTL